MWWRPPVSGPALRSGAQHGAIFRQLGLGSRHELTHKFTTTPCNYKKWTNWQIYVNLISLNFWVTPRTSYWKYLDCGYWMLHVPAMPEKTCEDLDSVTELVWSSKHFQPPSAHAAEALLLICRKYSEHETRLKVPLLMRTFLSGAITCNLTCCEFNYDSNHSMSKTRAWFQSPTLPTSHRVGF